jgi:hypothetical protein
MNTNSNATDIQVRKRKANTEIHKRVNTRRRLDTKNGNHWTQEMYDNEIRREYGVYNTQQSRFNLSVLTPPLPAQSNNNQSHSQYNPTHNNSNTNDSKSEAIPMEDIAPAVHNPPRAWPAAVQV